MALRQRVEHDLYYIENWSFWLRNLYVLAVTPFQLLDIRNAYDEPTAGSFPSFCERHGS